MVRSFIAVATAAFVLAACSMSEEEATAGILRDDVTSNITWGQPVSEEFNNVGTLLFVQEGEGFFSCTGTMISPRVMLTAAHCVAGQDADAINDVTYVRFDNDGLAGISNYDSTSEWLEADWIMAETVIAHPNWTNYGEFPITYDIGVVILPEAAAFEPSDGFGTIPELGFLEDLRGRDRQTFAAVGYGQQGTLRPFEMNEYVKYEGTVRLLEVKSYFNGFGASSAKFSNNPGVGGGTCYGDSGGPTFFQDTNIVVAVTSFGIAKNGNCVGNDFNYRTDIPAAQDFLNDVLAEYGDEAD